MMAATIDMQQRGAVSNEKMQEFLSFRTDGEEYGISILKVQEIRGFERPTRIANAPSHMLGVVNLRGVIVPIVDMKLKLGGNHASYDHNTVTIVLSIGTQVVGLVVDSVSDVVALRLADIKPAPDMGQAASSLPVIGIADIVQAQTHRMVILLDVDKLIAYDAAESEPIAAAWP